MASVCALSLMLGMGTAAAEKLKIGVVDIQQILQQAPQVKTINERLEKKYNNRQQEIVKLQEALKKNMEKLERDGAILSVAEKNTLEENIVTQRRDLQRKGQDYQQDLGREQNQEMQQFFALVKAEIDKVAKKEKYDLILQKDGVPYANDDVDVTAQVMKHLS